MEETMKGKKFTAAEKYFHEKEVKLRKEIQSYRDSIKEKNEMIKALESEVDSLKNENVSMEQWIERLLEYTELSKEDIKAACEKDKKLARAASLILRIGKFLPY